MTLITLLSKACKLHKSNKLVEFTDGTTIKYDKLFIGTGGTYVQFCAIFHILSFSFKDFLPIAIRQEQVCLLKTLTLNHENPLSVFILVQD